MTSPARLAAMRLASALGLAGVLAGALAGCGSADEKPRGVETDPAVSGALSDRLMVDPGLAGDAGAALSADGGRITLPPEERSAEAVEAARTQAVALAGGALLALPQPEQDSGGIPDSVTAAQVARDSGIAPADCAAGLRYSATWAARLPAEFPVYPRGAVQEGAGADSDRCHLRVVDFVTPVAPADVIAFYYTRARKVGYGASYRIDGARHALAGARGDRSYAVLARSRDDGMTQVDLVTGAK